MVKRIEDEYSTLESPMGRMAARRKAKGLCVNCSEPVIEVKRTTGKLLTRCRACLDKMKAAYDKKRGRV